MKNGEIMENIVYSDEKTFLTINYEPAFFYLADDFIPALWGLKTSPATSPARAAKHGLNHGRGRFRR